MRLQTLLNQLEKFKSFVYGRVTKEERVAGQGDCT